MTGPFDAVSIDALQRRRTVKWTLHGRDVLAAWVAEMDFDVAAPVRAALLEAVDREDFGYVPADLSELTTACAGFLASAYSWNVDPSRIFVVADVLAGITAALDMFLPAASRVVVPSPAYPPFFEIVTLGGREVVEVPMVIDDGRPTLDLDAIAGALSAGARVGLALQSAQPDRASLRSRRARTVVRGRRPLRRTRHRRRDPRAARLSRMFAPAVRDGDRRGGRAHGDGDLRVEGLERPRAEVRTSRHDESRGRQRLANAAGFQGAGPDAPRDRSVDRRVPLG